MDNYIRKLQVKSLFETKTNLNVDFDEKINCLFGVNGSGKTTIISILVASMFCDIAKLITLPFSEVSIFIAPTKKKKAKLFFKVTKLENTVEYCFNTEFYETGNSENKQLTFDSSRFSKRDLERQDDKKKTVILNLINSQVSTTYVPLSRMYESEIYDLNARPEEYYLSQALRSRHLQQEEVEELFDTSKRMLLKLETSFKQKYSETQKEINRNLDGLKDTILEKMLLNNDFASKYAEQNIGFKTKLNKPDSSEYSKKLSSVNLKISPTSLKEHFDVMESIVTNLNRIRDEYNRLPVQDVASNEVEKNKKKLGQEFGVEASKYRALNPIYERFFDVLKDVENIQVKKDELQKIFTITEKLINSFLVNKSFSFTAIGGFEIKCGERIIKLADLSSGEKHMIALLGRVALSPENGAVFVADEPELSLHLEWQRKILPAIQSLSPNIQIIVATHSPAIIPSGAKQIDLAECVK